MTILVQQQITEADRKWPWRAPEETMTSVLGSRITAPTYH